MFEVAGAGCYGIDGKSLQSVSRSPQVFRLALFGTGYLARYWIHSNVVSWEVFQILFWWMLLFSLRLESDILGRMQNQSRSVLMKTLKTESGSCHFLLA